MIEMILGILGGGFLTALVAFVIRVGVQYSRRGSGADGAGRQTARTASGAYTDGDYIGGGGYARGDYVSSGQFW